MLASLFALLLTVTVLEAVDLPAGIKPCKADATLDECATKTAKTAIKNLVKGDRKFKIPVFDPLNIEKLVLTESPGKSVSLNLTLNDIKIHDLSTAEFIKSQMDLKKKTIKWTFKTKDLKILSDYILDGKFLLVPITGKGKASIIIVEPVFTYSFDFVLKDIKGKQHAEIVNHGLDYELKKIKFDFEKLFNGDKTLGDNVNKLLNENWKDLNKMWGQGVVQAITTIIDRILGNILKIVPYEQIILPA